MVLDQDVDTGVNEDGSRDTGEHRYTIDVENPFNIKDDFCVQKCVSKAERNALRKLMPEKIIVEMIKEWQKGRKNAKSSV